MKIPSILTDITGQLTVLGVLMLFLTIIVLSTIMPMVIDSSMNMSEKLNASGLTNESLLAKMIPMFIVIAFLATIALYAAPMTRG